MNFVQEHNYKGMKFAEYICPNCSSTMMIPNYQQYSKIYCKNCESDKKWEYVSQSAKCHFCIDRKGCSQRELDFVQIK